MRINNREELEKEGLFIITDIEDGLLDKRIKDFIKEKAKIFNDERVEEAIKKNILNDVKDISRNENNNSQGVWHQIFHKLIPDNESLQQHLQQRITGNTCRLTELLDLYLGEVEFLYFEIAQMIIYNLKRLERMEEYKVDLEITDDVEALEELIEYIDIGKGDYRKIDEMHTNDKEADAKAKNIMDNLIPDMKRLRDKYLGKKQKVYFLPIQEDNIIRLESYFREVNFFVLANERFMNFITHADDGIKIDDLKKIVQNLNDTGNDFQYIWEKITNLNVDILLAELFGNLSAQETDKEFRRIIGENKVIRNMITNIRDMPNLFIRLLFVKSIIRCAVENPQCLCKANIQCLNNYLRIRNIQYTELMQNIMKYAVVYRKEAESDGKRIRQKWIAELEKEFPMQRFFWWRISQNIQVVYGIEEEKREIYVACNNNRINAADINREIIQPTGDNKWLEFKRVNKVCFEKDLDYLKKTFILQAIKEQMENEQEKFIENILPRIMNDWEISVIDRMDEDDPNIICTEIYEAEEKESLQEEEKRTYLKQMVESWLVSEQHSVMIEKFPVEKDKRRFQCLELLMKSWE